jgi:hypothetical protein
MNDIINIFSEYWMFLVPIIILQLILQISALIHLLKRQNYRFGNKVMWIVIVLFFQMIGPIIYFAFGKGEE